MAINQDKNKERPVVDSVKTGEFLAALRKAAGYTQQEVADYLNITNKTISKWESGAGLPEISILPAVAELYGVTVDELLAGKRIGRFVKGDASRRQWLENSLQERFRRGQVILWGTMLAGYLILLGLHMGLRNIGIDTDWISTVWCGVWLLAEGIGTYLFWSKYSNDWKAWQEENAEMQTGVVQKQTISQAVSGQENTSALRLHRWRMQLLLPFVLAVSAALPLMWIEPFVIPINIPAMAGAGEYITTAKELFAEVMQLDALFGNPELWLTPDLSIYDWTLGDTFITWERLLKVLPITLLAGSLIWGGLSLVGLLRLKYQPGQTKRRLRALALAGAIGFGTMFVVGECIQALQVMTYIQYNSQERFDQVVNGYLTVYNSYREYDKHSGPVLEYGAERIDHRHLDDAIRGNDHYDTYQGIFAIDYDDWRIYHIGSWEERIKAKNVSVLVNSVVSVAGLAIFWKNYTTANAQERKENDIA